MKTRFFIFILLFALPLGQSFAQHQEEIQTKSSTALNLFEEIATADSLLFVAFNTCDTLAYKEFFTDDLEFYHDVGGLTISLKNELQSFIGNCATGIPLRREIVKGSLEIYPIKNFGAIEIGTHRFYHKKPGEPERLNGSYKFVHVWRREAGGKWKLSRIISYGH